MELSGPESHVPKCYLRYSNAKKNILKSKAFLDYFPQLREQKMCYLSVYLMTLMKKAYTYLCTTIFYTNKYTSGAIIKD